MFDGIKSVFEDHPYVVGSIIVGGIIILVVSRSGSSSSGASSGIVAASPQYAPQQSADPTAQLQAATALAANQNNAILTTNQTNAALAAKQLDAQTFITGKTIDAQTTLEALHITGAIQSNANDFAYRSKISDNNTTLAVAQITNDTTRYGIWAGLQKTLFGGSSAPSPISSPSTTGFRTPGILAPVNNPANSNNALPPRISQTAVLRGQ